MTTPKTSTADLDRAPALPATISAIKPTDVPRQITLLRDATTADLKQRWRELFGQQPPPFSRSYLQSRLTYRVQELAYGGVKAETVARLAALGERLDGGNVTLRRIRADNRPIAGTQLIREYRSVQHVVTVLPDGFAYEGRPYRSLSAIARHITGTRWNGWVFFGLKAAGGKV